jgi:hypothetical protein
MLDAGCFLKPHLTLKFPTVRFSITVFDGFSLRTQVGRPIKPAGWIQHPLDTDTANDGVVANLETHETQIAYKSVNEL